MGFIKKAIIIAIIAMLTICLKHYMNGAVCQSSDRIDGKVVIVTGGNTGIGKETAIDLVKRGGKVYIGCRSPERAKQAVEEIKTATDADGSRIIFLPLDLASLQSVREFVELFKKRERRLDILINNAGVMWVPQNKTKDGFEETFGVNHLGHFMLTHLLMEHLISSTPSRVVTVSSLGHSLGEGRIFFEDLMFEKSFSTIAAYSQSKLANVLFSRELSRRLEGTGVTTYSLHPGAVATELQRHAPLMHIKFVNDLFLFIISPLIKDAWHGAQTSICCAVDKKLATETGKYYSDCKEKAALPITEDETVAKRLWDVSVELVKLDPLEIHPKLQ